MGSQFKSCYGCLERSITCHSTCEKYKIEKANHDALCAKIRADSGEEYKAYTRSKISKIEKATRRKHNKS